MTDIRLELYRERISGRYRWRVRVPGHILADSGQAYSRRVDCLAGGCRVVGIDAERIEWLGGDGAGGKPNRLYDYGQTKRAAGLVEVFVWKRWWRR